LAVVHPQRGFCAGVGHTPFEGGVTIEATAGTMPPSTVAPVAEPREAGRETCDRAEAEQHHQ
jgi:hypothetical protein